MSRKRSHKPRPKPSPTVYTVTKKAAAIGQLESAILLWFNEADPISILVLASNAHDCFHALGAKDGKPSPWMAWLDTLPTAFREREKYIQDFAKHGFKDLEEDAPYEPVTGGVVMMAAIDCHRNIYGEGTPLMKLFWTRFLFEHPDLANDNAREHFLKGAAIGLGSGSRKAFFDEYQSLLPKGAS
jgi:hypothetical protein